MARTNLTEVKKDTSGELTTEDKKDIRLIALEITNTSLQIQNWQNRYKELLAAAAAFETELLKKKNLSSDEHAIDFNTLEIVKKAKTNAS